ncbi:hypothetical protein D3C81_1906890 [compost metagenome]
MMCGQGAEFIGGALNPFAPAADQPRPLQLACMHAGHGIADMKRLSQLLNAPLPLLQQPYHPQADLAGQRLIYRQ